MYTKYRSRRALSHAHSQWNGVAFLQSTVSLAEGLEPYFKTGQIVLTDNDIIVTDIGYVVMAIHCNQAVRFRDALVIPGVDSEGRCGHLVLCEKHCPFHSYESNSLAAYAEARESQYKAQMLLSAFESRQAMREAVSAAPWYTLVSTEDFQRSGLCAWGAETFVRRYGLRTIANRFGLPKVVVRAAGVYGERLIAARLVRSGNAVSQSVSSTRNHSQRAI